MVVSLSSRFLVCFVFICSVNSHGVEPENVQSVGVEPLFYFDIPALELQEALISVGVQSGYSVIFKADVIGDAQSIPVVGRYELSLALNILLGKSTFAFKIDHGKKYIQLTNVVAKENKKKNDKKTIVMGRENLEEVRVVSARHREERIHEVPMSITQMGGDDIDAVGIQDMIQIGSYVPNTNLRVIRGTNTSLAIYIRGVGHDDPVAGLETSVGVYIDDVYFSRPQSVAIDLFDIERVEILRGPQGTLYGRNTIGGAVKYITRRIGDEPEFKLKGSLGSYSQQDVILSAGMPFSESFKVGGSVASFQRDGFGKNLVTGEEHYNKDVLASRMSVEMLPADDWKIRLSADYTKDDSTSRSGYLVNGTFGLPPLPHEYDTRAGLVLNNHPVTENSITVRGVSSSVDWEINDSWRVKFISAYRDDRSQLPSDIDSLEVVFGDAFSLYENEQASQEVRMAYRDDKTDALIGFYYLDSTAMSVFDLPGESVSLPGIPNVINTVIGTFDNVDVHSQSWFSTYSRDIYYQLNLSLGLRYTKEKRALTVIRNIYTTTSAGDFISPMFGGDGVSLAPFSELRDENGEVVWPRFFGERADEALTPRVSLRWLPNDAVNVYGSYSSGFKSGGFAPRGVFIDAELRKGFKPEKVETFEFGVKADFQESDLQTHLSFFYSRYENLQLLERTLVDSNGDNIGDTVAEVVRNGEEASIRGAEFELRAGMSTNWRTDVAIGYMDAKFERFISDEGENIAGQREFVSAPELSASISQSYELETALGRFRFDGSYHYQSASTFFHAPSEPVDQPGYGVANISANWFSNRDELSLGLSVLNLTDRRYRVSAFYLTGGAVSWGGEFASVYWGNPRTVSLSMTYKY